MREVIGGWVGWKGEFASRVPGRFFRGTCSSRIMVPSQRSMERQFRSERELR